MEASVGDEATLTHTSTSVGVGSSFCKLEKAGNLRFLVMPKKIRELKQMLRRVGFSELPGKGSHSNWVHPLYAGKLTISGKDGADAKPYQEKEVQKAIEEVESNQENEEN